MLEAHDVHHANTTRRQTECPQSSASNTAQPTLPYLDYTFPSQMDFDYWERKTGKEEESFMFLGNKVLGKRQLRICTAPFAVWVFGVLTPTYTNAFTGDALTPYFYLTLVKSDEIIYFPH